MQGMSLIQEKKKKKIIVRLVENVCVEMVLNGIWSAEQRITPRCLNTQTWHNGENIIFDLAKDTWEWSQKSVWSRPVLG